MRAGPSTAICIGKLPTRGDFVRPRTSTSAVRAFDDWLQEGLYQLRQTSSTWEDDFHATPSLGFVFTSGQRRDGLVGAIRPSRDRSGRAYPFAVACEVEGAVLSARRRPYLPYWAESFLDRARELVDDAVEKRLSYSEVAEQAEQVNPTFPSEPTEPEAYSRQLQQHTMEAFVVDLFGQFEAPEKYWLFKNLLDILRPLRGRSRPRLNYGLRFPLGTDSCPPTLGACFWMDVVLRLVDSASVVTPFFWTTQRPETGDPFLLLFLGEPRSRLVPGVFGGNHAEQVYQLAAAPSSADTDPAQAVPAPYRTALADRDLRVWRFLQSL